MPNYVIKDRYSGETIVETIAEDAIAAVAQHEADEIRAYSICSTLSNMERGYLVSDAEGLEADVIVRSRTLDLILPSEEGIEDIAP